MTFFCVDFFTDIVVKEKYIHDQNMPCMWGEKKTPDVMCKIPVLLLQRSFFYLIIKHCRLFYLINYKCYKAEKD